VLIADTLQRNGPTKTKEAATLRMCNNLEVCVESQRDDPLNRFNPHHGVSTLNKSQFIKHFFASTKKSKVAKFVQCDLGTQWITDH
jgi:hypothetical protein